ncbi:SRPBCC family protein [Streptomyces sp. NPDC088785]|uniref:SRPBCC family protein n=1 Tax=Streptomyces sp. NPDC088785 TaxID=3365897 RepID=UPI00380CBA01
MEHEVFVPVPAESVRAVLGDPLRVARALPGFQRDASGDAGRLKVRIDGHTITYRGSITVDRTPDGSFEVTGEGVEARGTGTVTFLLTARAAATEGGTTLTFTAAATGDGRVAEFPGDAVEATAQRLLNRFAENLAAAEQEPGTDPDPETDPETDPTAPEDSETDSDTGPEADPELEVTVYETDVPPSSLDPETDLPSEPAAAHARRTMIGRSAEEVDHAPPRGRYAPVPAPSGATATATLRWAAPAAALAVASAIVVGRALRRRR